MSRSAANQKRIATSQKSARFEGRMSPFALDMVKRAAEIQGRSVSDFIATAAQQIAQKTIEDMSAIKLSLDAQRAFAEAILNPPEPGAALKRALETHRRLIKESR
jgi:uncharacterized protein (DUF1778 family)